MDDELKPTQDSGVWRFARRASAGVLAGIHCQAGFLDNYRTEHAVVCSVYEGQEFPRDVITPFKRAFLLNATCARCGNLQSELKLRHLVSPGSEQRKRRPFVVCDCGHPVWKIPLSAYFEAGRAMVRPEYARRRREQLTAGGVRHTRSQLREILAIQENRCIYCNIALGLDCPATVDHILPVSMGGTDWALNIVMACWNCNLRRGTIPFRTYCKTLSPTQNGRVLKFLTLRLVSMRADAIQESELATFMVALRTHNPRNNSYRWILEHSKKRWKYASQNLLLPSVGQLLNRIRSLLPTKNA